MILLVRAPSLAVVHVSLRWLRIMNNRRGPGEVVGAAASAHPVPALSVQGGQPLLLSG